MSQALIYTLLGLALVLPLVGAAALRVFFGRLSEWQVALVATLVFGTAIASVLVLARSNADSLRIGGLTLLLPVTAPSVDDLPPLGDVVPSPGQPSLPNERTVRTSTPVITATISLTSTDTLTDTDAITPTNVLTETTATPLPLPKATLTPTVAITNTATVAPTATATAVLESTPTTAPPPTDTPPPPPPAARTYTVQNGDTLRSIAAQFNVSVADLLRANNLTAAQADSLRPGQVLTIP